MAAVVGGGGKRVLKYIKYETDSNGITTVTLSRPPVNAFNREMSHELILALDSFAAREGEKILILTGEGKAFSTGEDLRNIDLDWSNSEMSEYADQALRKYHEIVRMILRTGKPIIAMLNGFAAGAGMSIALACDERYALIEDASRESYDASIFFPAFVDMGLVADAGMTATLPRLVGKHKSQELCDEPGVRLTIQDSLQLGIIDACVWMSSVDPGFVTVTGKHIPRGFSPLAYGLSKNIRNEALLYKLDKRVFPWEFRAQTSCLLSDYFKDKAKAFLAKPKIKKDGA